MASRTIGSLARVFYGLSAEKRALILPLQFIMCPMDLTSISMAKGVWVVFNGTNCASYKVSGHQELFNAKLAGKSCWRFGSCLLLHIRSQFCRIPRTYSKHPSGTRLEEQEVGFQCEVPCQPDVGKNSGGEEVAGTMATLG